MVTRYQLIGGSGEIRTHGRVSPSLVFKTSALNHSATLPNRVGQDNTFLRLSLLASLITKYSELSTASLILYTLLRIKIKSEIKENRDEENWVIRLYRACLTRRRFIFL